MPSGVYIRTKETRIKISNIHKGMKHTKETRMKMSEVHKGFKHTEEAKRKMSRSMKGVDRKGEKNSMFGKHHSEETKRKIGEAGKGDKRPYKNPMSEKGRKNISIANIERYKKMSIEEKRKLTRKAIIASQKANPSSIEKAIWKVLDSLEINYKTQVPFCHGRFVVDICIPDRNLIIECNGTYWHNYDIFPEKKVRDDNLQKYCDKWKVKLIWLWEDEIKRDAKNALKREMKIKNEISEKEVNNNGR